MIDTKRLAELYADADADNTMADEYRKAVDEALLELLAEVERSRKILADSSYASLRSNLEGAMVAVGIAKEAMGSARKRIAALEAEVEELRRDKDRLETARPYSEWHEDLGPVLWHMMPIQCSPYVGDPMCCDWPFKTDRNLFWTPLPDCNLIQDRFEAARKGEPK